MNHNLFILCVLIGLSLLTSCIPRAIPAPGVDVVVPTLEVSATTSMTMDITPTVEVTEVMSLSPTATERGFPPPTSTPLASPTVEVPPSGYPILLSPSPTVPPVITTDGLWWIVTTPQSRFELPSDWAPYWKYNWFANFVPKDGGAFTQEEWNQGLMKLDYRADTYYHYADYELSTDYEPLVVDGYPAFQRKAVGEWGDSWGYSLIVEGPDAVYTFGLIHWVHPDVPEAQKQEFYERGDRVFQHIIETVEILTPAPEIQAIGSQIMITGTVASVAFVEEFSNKGTIYLAPSSDNPYTQIHAGIGHGTHITTPYDGDLVISQLQPGDRMQILGRPASESALLGDTILMLERTEGEEPFDDETIVTGQVIERHAELGMVVLDIQAEYQQQILILEDTYIMYADERRATFDDIHIGDTIQVYAPAAMRLLEARHITIFDYLPTP